MVGNALTYTPPQFTTIANLRLNTIAYPTVYVQGYTAVNDGGQGTLNYVASDTTTADNNCTIFVDSSGRRYYRPVSTEVSVKWCGAKGDGSTDDTLAIQRAINFARLYQVGGLVSGGGLCVVFPTSTYIISSLDATNWQSGCLRGAGGSGSAAIYAQTQTSSKPIIDLTSSRGILIDSVLFFGTTTGGVAPSVQPSVGILMGVGVTLADSDIIRLNFAQFNGFFVVAACYIDRVTDIIMTSVACSSSGTSTGWGLVMSDNNVLGVTSPYAPGSGSTASNLADITWYGGAGGIGSNAGSAGAVLLHGCVACRFYDGVIDANGAFQVEIEGTTRVLSFNNIQFEGSTSTPQDIFFFNGGTATQVFVSNPDISDAGYSRFIVNGSGTSISGGVFLGVPAGSFTGGISSSFSHLP
jgi:hypothetical protein